jgi:signal transduction histidine kinase
MIEVELTYDRSGLRMVIRDNGIGIAEEVVSSGVPGHWGISGMRERAQQIGARLSLWSRPGAGTEVDLRIPAKLAYLRVQKSNRESWIHSVVKRRKSR